MQFQTNSSAQIKKIAALLAKEILADKPKRKNALVFALIGDLGSGKTTFTQGFLRGLGIKNKITSPTFVIAKSYKLKAKSYKLAYHFDCYRIRKPAELLDLGLREIICDSRNIVLIEWPEVVKKVLPKNSVWIRFGHGDKENKRTISFHSA